MERTCPDWGREHAVGLFEEAEAIRFRDSSIGDFETFLEVEPMRAVCCGGTRIKRLPWATVAKVNARAIELGLRDSALDLTKLRWIGVDEVS